MTEAQLALADIVLRKIPVKQAISVSGYMSSALIGESERFTSELFTEIAQMAHSRDSSIRTFLLQEKYIKTIDHSIPKDILTDKGEKAQVLGGHEKYKIWEEDKNRKEEKRNRSLNWPQKHWGIIIIISALAGAVATLALQLLSDKLRAAQLPKASQSQPTIQLKADTVYIYRIDTNKAKLLPPAPTNKKRAK